MFNKKPLYVILDENYKNTIEKDMLQEKKEKLAKIRDLNKPISLEDLKEHEKRHNEIKRLRESNPEQYISQLYKKR